MDKVKIVWGVQLDEGETKVRAFVRLITVSGVMVREQLATYRLADPAERAYMRSDLHDTESYYQIARSFFPAPEAMEGVGCPVAEWLNR